MHARARFYVIYKRYPLYSKQTNKQTHNDYPRTCVAADPAVRAEAAALHNNIASATRVRRTVEFPLQNDAKYRRKSDKTNQFKVSLLLIDITYAICYLFAIARVLLVLFGDARVAFLLSCLLA